jgi:hypothetical protein
MRLKLLATLALAACSQDPTRIVCTADVRPALAVTVVDAVSGAPRAGEALAVARDDRYSDTLRVNGFLGDGTPIALTGADERPGTYDLTVEHAGYRTWSATNVRVTSNTCHVQTVELTARLEPLP